MMQNDALFFQYISPSCHDNFESCKVQCFLAWCSLWFWKEVVVSNSWLFIIPVTNENPAPGQIPTKSYLIHSSNLTKCCCKLPSVWLLNQLCTYPRVLLSCRSDLIFLTWWWKCQERWWHFFQNQYLQYIYTWTHLKNLPDSNQRQFSGHVFTLNR